MSGHVELAASEHVGAPAGVSEPAAPPGRICPLHYLYSPRDLVSAPELPCEIAYVVGGLYGNRFALDAVEVLAAREAGPVTIVFNGDFHWFDREPSLFRAITQRVLAHRATRGNVETELAASDDTAGCGCAYPDEVCDADVERSNSIEHSLRGVARAFPDLVAAMAGLPMYRVLRIGDARIGVVHGDAQSLAGWGFSRAAMATAHGKQRAADWLAAAQVQVFACTHTCQALYTRLDTVFGAGIIINNGAAGMPAFSDSRHGVITRIATRAPPPTVTPLYGGVVAGAHVDALALHYEHAAWWREFRRLWPRGSAADLSYAARIRAGGHLPIAQAVL